MADIRIDNGLILTVDPGRRIIENGSVVIDADRIVDVGKTQKIKARYPAKKVIDASRMLVMPGLVNAHIHSDHHLHKGISPEFSASWSNFVHKNFVARLTAEDEIYGGLGVLLETLKSGATTFLQAGSFYEYEVMDAVDQVGMRGWMGKKVFDQESLGHTWKMQTTEECLRANEDFLQKYQDRLESGSRVKPCVNLVGLGRISDRLLIESKKMADKYGVPLHIHVAAFLGEVSDVMAKTGHRPVEHLYKLGVLGPNVVMVHMIHVNDREIQMLKECDARVVHCPATALKLAYGLSHFSRIPEMMNAGVTVALGSDASDCANYNDMVRVMYLAAAVWKDLRFDAATMTAEKVIEMATINGARALGMEKEIGSIEKGKKADIAIMDMDRPEWIPMNHPVQNLVYSATGDSAHTVIIDGKIVMENRVVKTIDEKAVLGRVQKLGEDLLKKSKVGLFGTWKFV